MNDAEKPALRTANENPWYCLATLHGEQPADGLDHDLADKNYLSWNRWIALGPTDTETLAEFAQDFARRTTLKLPEPGSNPDFSHTHFNSTVNFAHFEFSRPTDFTSARFSGMANFTGAHFTGVNFQGVMFSFGADFNSAQFSGMANFRSATFSFWANFDSVMVFDRLEFTWATFVGMADFVSATISRTALFDNATFYDIALFQSTTFKGAANFRSAKFFRDINFINTKFTAHTSFAGVLFESRVPDFRGATMHDGTEWHGVVWPKPPASKAEAQSQVYAYERLKQEMERLKKHEDEQSFFRKELRARRGLFSALSGGWLLNLVYQASSDYGNSIGRPLIWLFGVFAAGIAVFTHVPLCAGQPMPFRLGIRLSFANLLIFLNDRRELTPTLDMVSCLSNTTAAVSAAQSIFGVVLLFLVGLALRNRFRMK